MKVDQRSDYTFKHNRLLGRHGWLRLTPAYSVKMVKEIVDCFPEDALILDPFSGTATTGLAAAEHGLTAHCFDINPFLIWLGNAKCRTYAPRELERLRTGVDKVIAASKLSACSDNWLPPIHNITRWWCGQTLTVLAALRGAIANEFGEPQENNVSALAWIAFCRLIIETSSAAFNHVSMSFHDAVTTYEFKQVESIYRAIVDAIVESAKTPLRGSASVHFVDSREPVSPCDLAYSHVVTSPPYPNRISYIRELRPYMYWTRFLNGAPEAGELDWAAIGGTWGVATSRLKQWEPDEIEPSGSLNDVVSKILATDNKNSALMAKYVGKYFHDMHVHLKNLRGVLGRGAEVYYIVGNSSFYGIQVHTEKLLEESLKSLGFANIDSKVVRKRNSKKELFEYCVCGTYKSRKKSLSTGVGGRRLDKAQLEFKIR